ncbi:MAG TPA: hypothetical protein VJU80_14645, partial [Solirubrobacteraceae bacterium]|nr:hypothetical protein [Solirubrobacteraceae bacterium]
MLRLTVTAAATAAALIGATGALASPVAAPHSSAVAHAARSGVGDRICATGRPVRTRVLRSESLYTNKIFLLAPRRRFLGLDSATGRTSKLGSFARGTELVLGIRVRDTGDLFKTGPASRNRDGVHHAAVHRRRDGAVVVGF